MPTCQMKILVKIQIHNMQGFESPLMIKFKCCQLIYQCSHSLSKRHQLPNLNFYFIGLPQQQYNQISIQNYFVILMKAPLRTISRYRMLPSDHQLKAIQKRLQSLSGSQLEIEIVTMLREPKRHIIHSVVKVIPKEVIIDCMMQTIDVQSQGGMKQSSTDIDSDEKKKSAGGVFLTLLKKNMGVTKEMMKRLLKAEKDRARDKRRTLSMLDGLDIDKIKIPKLIQPQEIQEIQTQGASVDQNKGDLNAEMLDSLPDI